MGVRVVQVRNEHQMLSLQHARALLHNVNPKVHSQSLSQEYPNHQKVIPGISMAYAVFAGCCAHCRPISVCGAAPMCP